MKFTLVLFCVPFYVPLIVPFLGLLQLWRGWKFILPSLFCSWTSLLWSIPRRRLWKLFGCSIRMGKCFNVPLRPFFVPICPIPCPIRCPILCPIQCLTTLCSRNFQSVKLRLDFVEIWSFYRHSDYTSKSNFGEFKRSKNVIFGNFRDTELWFFVNFGLESCWNWVKSKFRTSKNCQKWHFWIVCIRQNLI